MGCGVKDLVRICEEEAGTIYLMIMRRFRNRVVRKTCLLYVWLVEETLHKYPR